MKKKQVLNVLEKIIVDCERDVKNFDGKMFNGRILGEMYGILEAKIRALAKIVKELVNGEN